MSAVSDASDGEMASKSKSREAVADFAELVRLECLRLLPQSELVGNPHGAVAVARVMADFVLGNEPEKEG